MLIARQPVNWKKCFTEWKAPLAIILLNLLLFFGSIYSLIQIFTSPATADTSQIILAVTFILATLLGTIVSWFIWRDYVEPLSQLSLLTQSMLAGNLESRILARPGSTFAPLAEDVNALGDMLLAQSNKTEAQINAHLAHITHKNNSLEILYHVAASVNHSNNINELLSEHLDTLNKLINSPASIVYLYTESGETQTVACKGPLTGQQLLEITSQLSEKEKNEICWITDLNNRIENFNQNRILADKKYGIVCIPLVYRDKKLGSYDLLIDEDDAVNLQSHNELLTSISQHLALAIAQYRLNKKTASLSRMQERTSIANELHDSLAQTIASIRFQARVLDDTLHQNDEKSAWQEMERLENSIDEANTELRELIAHFRVPLNERGLISGVQAAVKRFRQETGIPIFLQNEWPNNTLPAETEIQVLRIIQESLANIRKHAEANAVRVMLKGAPPDYYTVLIEDDGVGIENEQNESNHPGEHIGLSIMRERANRIHGKLKIESELGEGTRIILSFRYSENNKKPLELKE